MSAYLVVGLSSCFVFLWHGREKTQLGGKVMKERVRRIRRRQCVIDLYAKMSGTLVAAVMPAFMPQGILERETNSLGPA